MKLEGPPKIGDRLIFAPDARSIGWSWPSFGRVRLKPGDSGTVTRIDPAGHVFLDDDRGGFHWQCFDKCSDEAER